MTRAEALDLLKDRAFMMCAVDLCDMDCQDCHKTLYMAIQALKQEPKWIPVTESSRATGKWIPLVMNGEYKCSVCGRASKSDNAAWVNIPTAYWNYCPNCGARMESDT